MYKISSSITSSLQETKKKFKKIQLFEQQTKNSTPHTTKIKNDSSHCQNQMQIENKNYYFLYNKTEMISNQA